MPADCVITGQSVICDQLLKDGLVERALQQLECFDAGIKFAKNRGLFPHQANMQLQVIREAGLAKRRKRKNYPVLIFCGHGL